MKSRAHVFISGRVQGVFFRASTREEAIGLGLTGWVRNMSDGRVEAVFEGDESVVDEMVSWCNRGPPHSRVRGVDVTKEDYRGEFEDFGVRY
jgi:acylphosphatase